MSFQILQRAYAPYGTAAQFPASGDSRLIYRATDTGYLYTWDASESAYKLAGIDPTTAPYLGLHAQADDSAMLGGQLPSYYETAIGNPSANGYLLSSTTAGVRSWVAPYAHPATHAQSAIDSSTGWITTALAGKQAAGSYLTTSTNYAGSSSPGGAATTALACTGNAATATKLATARTLTIGSTGKTFDGSANVTWTLSEIGAVSQETGTWSPMFSAQTAPTGVTQSMSVGRYVKIGNMCEIDFGLIMTSKGTGGSGYAKIINLPFASYSSTMSVVFKGGGRFVNMANAADAYRTTMCTSDGTSYLTMARNDNTFSSNILWSDLLDNSAALASLVYRTLN